MSETPEKPHGIIYFHPGQLIFHARGTTMDINEGKKQALLDWANSLAARKGMRLASLGETIDFEPPTGSEPEQPRSVAAIRTTTRRGVEVPKREVISDSRKVYKSPEDKVPPPFSLITATVDGKWSSLPEPTAEDGILVLTPEERKELKAQLDQIMDLAYYLDSKRGSAPVDLEVVALNWTMSVGKPSEPGDTGGPGGRPSPVCEDDIDKYPIKIPSTTALPGYSDVTEPDRGEGVVVAILDTAYTKAQLNDFYKTWVLDKRASGERVHPIVDALLRDDSVNPGALREADGRGLRVEINPSLENYMKGIEIDGHDYDMTDHGLFVAGIINSLAPKAKLHLYQVLNKYGLGDLDTISRMLRKIVKTYKGQKLVVNLSLTMNMPLGDGYLKPNDELGMGRSILGYRPSFLRRLFCWVVCWIFERLLDLPCPGFCESWFERQARPFEQITDLIYTLDSRVIAAAGNQSKKGARQEALYPAALERVLGVGALARNGLPASYSNLADQPVSIGITTLGGEEGPRKGIIGVYLGEFPEDDLSPRPTNRYGLAWWSGTSFATPIITGMTAAVLAGLSRVPTLIAVRTEDAITRVFDASSWPNPDGEFSFTVDQT